MSESSLSPIACPQCGAALPAEATENLCPRCLMAQAMQPPAEADEVVPVTHVLPGPHGGQPNLPLPEELTALLPADTYSVERVIGRGGMGAVYKGAQLRLQRAVAIKIMRRDQGRDHDFALRFQREALAMAKLNHPNIVSVIDYGEAGPDYLYIVMELVDGADMMDVIRTGRMTQEMALLLLPQICDALQFAHDHGIIHRDIKPSNVMLTRDGRIKIADFGLAKRYDVETSFQTQSGTSMGTPDYAAPEQFMGDTQIDHRADIYALGVMIYQMLTGQLPRGVWKPPSQQAVCDPHWDDIVDHAMQTDPKDRYQAASEVKTDVSRITDDRAAAPSAAGSDSKIASHAKAALAGAGAPPKSRGPLVLGIIASIIILAVGAFFAWVGDDVRSLASPAGTGGAEQKTNEQQRLVTSSPADTTHTFAGHRYEFMPGALRWDEAKAKAEAMGGHLTTITSKEENEFIYAAFGDKLDPSARASSIWIGGFADDMGLPFKWVTDEPFVFNDWSVGEPDHSGTSGQPMSGVFGIVIKRHVKLGWFDDPVKRDNVKAGFIVEWDDDGTRKPAPFAPGAVDLLALADVVKDALGGIWSRKGTDLIVAESPETAGSRGVRFGFALPVHLKGSYQLEVEFTRHGPRSTVCLLLPLPNGRSVVAHFQESQPYAGLVDVRGRNTRESDNPTRTPCQLEDGCRYRGVVKVLLQGGQVDIAATLEGKPLFRFQGPVTDLESQRLLAMEDPTRPGLKSIDPVTWHSVRLTPLDGGTFAPVRAGVTLPAATGAAAP